MNASEIADRLDEAADLMWLRGRCVGTGVTDDGRLCVVGAISYASAVKRDFTSYDVAIQALGRFVGKFVPYWNDELPVTSENDAYIVDQIRRCAKSLREESSCS